MEGFVDWLFGWSREYQRRVPNGVSARDVAFVFVLYETDNECIQYDCVLVTVRTANVWFSRPPRNSVVTTVRFIPEMGSGGVEPHSLTSFAPWYDRPHVHHCSRKCPQQEWARAESNHRSQPCKGRVITTRPRARNRTKFTRPNNVFLPR